MLDKIAAMYVLCPRHPGFSERAQAPRYKTPLSPSCAAEFPTRSLAASEPSQGFFRGPPARFRKSCTSRFSGSHQIERESVKDVLPVGRDAHHHVVTMLSGEVVPSTRRLTPTAATRPVECPARTDYDRIWRAGVISAGWGWNGHKTRTALQRIGVPAAC